MIDIHQPISKIGEDLLGRSEIARVILKCLASRDCPESIGIYGGWGTGKTSLLNLIKHLNYTEAAALALPLEIEIIDIWPHEQVNSLLAPVITRLLSKLNGTSVLQEAAPAAARVLIATGLVMTDVVLKQLGSSREEVRMAYGDACTTFPWLQDLQDRIQETEAKRKQDLPGWLIWCWNELARKGWCCAWTTWIAALRNMLCSCWNRSKIT